MKKIIFGIIFCFILIFFSFLSLGLWLVLFAPDLNSVEYYSDDKNYSSFECTVSSFNVYEDCIIIEFTHSQENFYDDFNIRGKNFDLAIKNGLVEVLRENAIFTISSADAYLGDGWCYPIVALTYNGNEIIPYTEGKQNFVDYQQQAENRSIKYLIIAGGIFISLIVIETGLIILYMKKRKNI